VGQVKKEQNVTRKRSSRKCGVATGKVAQKSDGAWGEGNGGGKRGVQRKRVGEGKRGIRTGGTSRNQKNKGFKCKRQAKAKKKSTGSGLKSGGGPQEDYHGEKKEKRKRKRAQVHNRREKSQHRIWKERVKKIVTLTNRIKGLQQTRTEQNGTAG